MSVYIGPFYLPDRDIFILLAIFLLVIGWVMGVKLPIGDLTSLVYLSIIFLLMKGFVHPEKEGNLLILFLSGIFLSFFIPVTTLFLFIFLSVLLFRLVRLV